MSSEERYQKLDAAIRGGVTGAALGALFLRKRVSTAVSVVVGAALRSSYAAFNAAGAMGSNVLIKDGNALYKVHPSGKKERVKVLKQSHTIIPKRFTLE